MNFSHFLCMVGIAILCFCFNHTQGQDKNIKIINSNTEQIFNLLKQAQLIRKIAPDSAIKLALTALKISKNIKDNNAIINSSLDLGSYLFDEEQYLQCKTIYFEALSYFPVESNDESILLPLIYNNIANVYIKQGYSDSAIHFYYLSLFEIKGRRKNNQSLLMLVYSNLGAALAVGKQNDQALFYLRKAMIMAHQLNDTNLLAQNFINIGLTFENIERGDSAIIYYKKL